MTIETKFKIAQY